MGVTAKGKDLVCRATFGRDCPDRRPRVQVAVRRAIGRERDRRSIGRPGQVSYVEVAACDLSKPRTLARRADPELIASVQDAHTIEAPVEAVDAARGRAAAGRCLSHEEPWKVCRSHDGHPVARRVPGECCDAVSQRRERPWLATSEVQDHQLGRFRRLLWKTAQEAKARPIWAESRMRVPYGTVGQLPRPPPVQWCQPEMRAVGLACDKAPHDRGGRPHRCEVMLLEDDLAPDHLGHHRRPERLGSFSHWSILSAGADHWTARHHRWRSGP